MKRTLTVITGVFLAAAPVFGVPCFGYVPSWESADDRSTLAVALGDFNGDGWQYEPHEWKDGDGERHVFYLDHWPALTIEEIRINGQLLPRYEYCFDAYAGWYSFKTAPELGALVSVAYTWSNRLDLFAGTNKQKLTDGRDVIYFNTGEGLSRAPEWFSDGEDYTDCAAAADFDADGDVDVAIAGVYYTVPGIVKVYRNTGSGLENTPSWEVPAGSPYAVAWGDVNADGFLELAVADISGGLRVYENHGGELEKDPWWFPEVGGSYMGAAWGDADGDGDMDLAGSTYAFFSPSEDGYAYVFGNPGDGTLERTAGWRNAAPEGRCSALAWGDVNGDGWLDLVKGIRGGGGGLDPYPDIYYSERGALPETPSWESARDKHNLFTRLFDGDGDGGLDLFQTSGSSVEGYFWRNGKLRRQPGWIYSVGAPFKINSIDAGDINGDGRPDLALAVATIPGEPRGGPNLVFYNKANIGITVTGFAASSCGRGVALRWEVNEAVAGFNLLREFKGVDAATEPVKVNAELITGRSPYRYIDADVSKGVTYRYWLEVVPLAGPAERHGPVECTTGVKASFALAQNAPNPARGATTVAFSVPAACDATLSVYDIAGRKVATAFEGAAKAGENEISVDVSSLAPGVYAYRLEAGGASAARKMVVTR